MAKEILKLTKEVDAATEDCETYIPANGANVTILKMVGETASNLNTTVKLIWDLGGTETLIWAIKGSNEIIFDNERLTGDGVKKLAICLDNGESDKETMSGYAEILVN